MSSFLFGSTTSRVNTPPTPEAQLRIQTSVAGRAVPIGWGQSRLAGNLIWYGDFQAIPVQQSGGGGGGGKGGGGGQGNGTVSYTYQAAVAIALCEGPVSSVLGAWDKATAVTLAGYNLTAFDGSYSQGSWGYMDSLHPSQSLDYRGLSYAAAGPMPLGPSADLPQLTFEVLFTINTAYAGVPDADPSAVIADFLTSENYGAGFPSAFLGDLSLYQSYCLAAGLVVSDALTDQKAANTYLADLLSATNAEFVWASGLLTIVPYGDAGPLSANGYSYTPPSVPLFSLGDDDFMKNTGVSIGSSSFASSDPLICVQKRRSDQLNDIKVEYLDRSNIYNPTIIEAKDDAAIAAWGLRPSDTKSWHFFCLASAATMSAQLQLARQQVLNQYSCTVDQRFIVLDPMDLIEITDLALGLVNAPVLVKEITENQQDSSLTLVLEDYLGPASAMPAYGTQANAGFTRDYNADPGDANAPLIFEPPLDLTGGPLQVWMAVSGIDTALWGGCQVWISTDNATYQYAGQVLGASRQGVLTSSLPVGCDPDLAHTLGVDLSMSASQLLSGTQADADAGVTLCWVANDASGGELIAYETATLTATSRYDLTYLRRGLHGTGIHAHSAGDGFARMSQGMFAYGYSPSQIGQTIYVKLLSFNTYDGGLQSLAGVSPTTYVITGPPPPADVTGFSASQNGAVVAFSWNRISNDFLKGYDIGYAPVGTSAWSDFIPLTEAAAGTEMTNGEVPPGSWIFGIRARDLAGNLSPDIATFALTVTHEASPAIAAVEQAPDWFGSLSGFMRHWTGVLVPTTTQPWSHYATWSALATTFFVDPVSSATYTAPVIDTGYDDTLRVFTTEAASALPGETGPVTGLGFAIDTWLTGASDPNSFTSWTINYVDMRYLRGQLTYTPTPGAVGFVTEFTPTVDTAPTTTEPATVAVAMGGTAVTFSNPFHIPPDVQVSPVSSTAASASASSVTATGFTFWLWDHTGASIAGTGTYTATGE